MLGSYTCKTLQLFFFFFIQVWVCFFKKSGMSSERCWSDKITSTSFPEAEFSLGQNHILASDFSRKGRSKPFIHIVYSLSFSASSSHQEVIPFNSGQPQTTFISLHNTSRTIEVWLNLENSPWQGVRDTYNTRDFLYLYMNSDMRRMSPVNRLVESTPSAYQMWLSLP